jgi:NAD(P)-dependent dehydrogenase (short-subunit alcohol dehydrogenase family)
VDNSQDKVCVITGATSGIGRASAFKLAGTGATLILLGRNLAKGKIVSNQLIKNTGNNKITFYKADLSLMNEIKVVSEKIKSDYEKIDILLNNAGARFLNHILTIEGIEQTLALNHLGYFYLTKCLLEKLRISKSARIINVSSAAHRNSSEIINNITQPTIFNGKVQYANSKLANILFTYELADRLKDTTVTVNAVDPGGVATNFARNNGLIHFFKHRIFYLIRGKLITPAKAADSILYLATSPEVERINGKYFYDKNEIKSSSLSYNLVFSKELWEKSEELISKVVI